MVFYPNINQKYHEIALSGVISENRLTDEEAQLIRSYLVEYEAVGHVGKMRIQKTCYALVQWKRFIQAPYPDVKIEQIYEAINTLKTAKNHRGKPFLQNTKNDYVLSLRSFLIWLIDNNHSELPLDKTRKIGIPVRDLTTVMPDAIHDARITAQYQVFLRYGQYRGTDSSEVYQNDNEHINMMNLGLP